MDEHRRSVRRIFRLPFVLSRYLMALLIALVLFAPISATPAAAAPINAGIVGTNAVTLRLDSVREKQFNTIQSDGFSAVRLLIEWPIIEPVKGRYDWTMTDQLIVGALQRGLTVLGVVSYTPSWAAEPAGRSYIHPGPASATTFGDFVTAAAQRYKGLVRNWEIWNEPNIVQSFAPTPNIAKYASMLKAAYTNIKKIDPYSVVITGGTSPAIDATGTIAPATFVDGLYKNGAGNYFDAVAMHPYSVPDLLSTEGSKWYSSTAAITGVTNVLLKNNQSYKKIWFTEFGASTIAGNQYGVTEARQADILVDGIKYMRSLANCGPIFLFDHLDIQTGSSNIEYNYGLRRSDFTPKPALAAVRAVQSAM